MDEVISIPSVENEGMQMEVEHEEISQPEDVIVKSTLNNEFVWEEYLEETQTEAVPPTAFPHVEKSLESGVTEDHYLEVVQPPTQDQPNEYYWVARVATTCGPLLRLRYVTPGSINVECWKEISAGGLHPLGWSAAHNIPLTPPVEVVQAVKEEEDILTAKNEINRIHKEGLSVPEEALDNDGYTAVDRIKQGMKVEVMYDGDPLNGWVATIMDNVGGRLLLRYDTPDCSGEMFWLFYLHPRLRPPDWIYEQGLPWKYKHPVSSSSYEEEEWAALLEMSRDDGRHLPLPTTLFLTSLLPDQHHFQVGMNLEAVHPFRPDSIHVAVIKEVINERFFRLSLDSSSGEHVTWVSSVSDPFILPIGFCKKNEVAIVPPKDWPKDKEFDWEVYVGSFPCTQQAEPRMFTEFEAAEELGFVPGMKLEAIHPSAHDQVCVATIRCTYEHLATLSIDSDPNVKPIIRATMSQDIFPTGWSQSNNYPLLLPFDYSPPPKNQQSTSVTDSQEKAEDSNLTDTVSGTAGNQRSLWCPRLYVNHWCYTGPYLSRSKVAKQSQSVGPGSAELVLREVVSMTINAAYIPTRVLRELERHGPDPQFVPSTWHPTQFKAKFKRYAYSASIPVATTASEISDFLNLICQILQCCPNLWSQTQTGENCPYMCTSQMAVQGQPYSCSRGRGKFLGSRGGKGSIAASRMLHRRKRGGRKRLFVPVRANRLMHAKSLTGPSDDLMDDGEEEEDPDMEEGDDDEVGSGSDEGDTSSRSSRPTSPLLDLSGNRRKRRTFPKLEMQTRGVKLPDFAIQMKIRHTKKKFDMPEGSANTSGSRDEFQERKQRIKKEKKEFPDVSSGLEPALVSSDPLEWTVHDVEHYVASQPTICHHAVKLREQEIDGRAFLLLNLPTLVQHLGLPHSSAVTLAQHICRVKLAHFLFFYTDET